MSIDNFGSLKDFNEIHLANRADGWEQPSQRLRLFHGQVMAVTAVQHAVSEG